MELNKAILHLWAIRALLCDLLARLLKAYPSAFSLLPHVLSVAPSAPLYALLHHPPHDPLQSGSLHHVLYEPCLQACHRECSEQLMALRDLHQLHTLWESDLTHNSHALLIKSLD